MSGRTKQLARNAFRTDLNHPVGLLPGRSLKSILELFAHLENLAARQESRSAFALSQPAPVVPGPVLPENHFGKVSFRDLGRQIVRAAAWQVCSLQHRLQEVQALVLINTWPVAEDLWSRLLPDCKTPLFEINFLEELWGISPDQLHVNGWSLTRQWHEFVLLQAEIESLLGRRRSLVELSDTLERDLGLWLRRFAELLEKLDELSVA